MFDNEFSSVLFELFFVRLDFGNQLIGNSL